MRWGGSIRNHGHPLVTLVVHLKIQLYSKESPLSGKISSKAKHRNHENGKPTLETVFAQNPGKFDLLSDSISLPCCYRTRS